MRMSNLSANYRASVIQYNRCHNDRSSISGFTLTRLAQVNRRICALALRTVTVPYFRPLAASSAFEKPRTVIATIAKSSLLKS